MKKTKEARGGRRSPLRWGLPLIVVLIMIISGLAAANRSYMILGGEFISRDPGVTDLRTYRLSLGEYENIKAQYPERIYRWSIPLSGGRFDSDSESITVGSFTEEDLHLLSYFTNLRTIDAREADISPELYAAVTAAWPEVAFRWMIPLGTGRYDSQSETLTLVSDFPKEELPRFAWFPSLRTVDARSCRCYEQLLALREQMPEVQVLWQISLEGAFYDQDTRRIAISGTDMTLDSFRELLRLLPELERVDMSDCPFTAAEQSSLQAAYPELTFGWEIEILGMRLTTAEEAVSLAGRTDLGEAEYEELLNAAPMLRGWKNLDLTGCPFTREQIMALCDAMPETHVLWSFDWCGVPVTTADEEVDLSNIPMSDTQAVEEMLPYMFNLKKVIMCDCGIEDEEMDALNHRHEDVRFVWMLHITRYNIRTDALGFRGTVEHHGYFTGETAWKLTYCEDMICLDLGHRAPDDLSFLTGMPQIKYLCLNGSPFTDITPVGTLQNLEWLELFMSSVTDLSPLINCKKLCDLNIVVASLPDQDLNFQALSQMPWLERLWYSDLQLSEEQEAKLHELLPNTEFYEGYSKMDCTAGTWRADLHYYEMRDILDMWYMGPYGGVVTYRVIDGVRYDKVDGEWVKSDRSIYEETTW